MLSEAVLLAILTPVAGAFSALVLKIWESIAKKKQLAVTESKTLRDDYRDERDSVKKEFAEYVKQAEKRQREDQEALHKAKMDYMELYQQFYFLRLAHAQETQDSSTMNAGSLGMAPHERRESLSKLDEDK